MIDFLILATQNVDKEVFSDHRIGLLLLIGIFSILKALKGEKKQ